MGKMRALLVLGLMVMVLSGCWVSQQPVIVVTSVPFEPLPQVVTPVPTPPCDGGPIIVVTATPGECVTASPPSAHIVTAVPPVTRVLPVTRVVTMVPPAVTQAPRPTHLRPTVSTATPTVCPPTLQPDGSAAP
ncbi:MAG: hypothetical protein ACUVX9_13340 [Anaerolineae bacterium]